MRVADTTCNTAAPRRNSVVRDIPCHSKVVLPSAEVLAIGMTTKRKNPNICCIAAQSNGFAWSAWFRKRYCESIAKRTLANHHVENNVITNSFDTSACGDTPSLSILLQFKTNGFT